MQNIIENATITYKNGIKELCDAISITEKGVYTGQVNSIAVNEKGFIVHSFVPKDQIRKIIIFNENGESKDIDFKNE